MSKPIIYQVLTRLWKDGKMSSFDQASFDYLHSLGISHIWYTGIVRHASGEDFVKGDPGCPYSIANYYDVNPYLADKPEERIGEFEDLVSRTHQAGFKVIIDFIPNHVSPTYRDGFGGIPTCGWHDYDWTDTDKIDYGKPETWEKMYQIVRFWALKGIDGFRCDMVELVPIDFFRWLTGRIKAEFPNIVFVAEVYEKNNYRSYVEHAGFDWLYDKSGLYDELKAVMLWDKTARAITWNWQMLGDLQRHMLNFLENHDEQRLASHEFAGSAENGYAALAVGALLNAAPYMIYFGQEIGEDASESDNCRTSIFNWTKRFWPGAAGKSSVLVTYREVLGIAAQAGEDTLTYDLCYCQNGNGFDPDRHFTFLRHFPDGRTLLVFCNFAGAEAKADVIIPDHAIEWLGLPDTTPRIVQTRTEARGYSLYFL